MPAPRECLTDAELAALDAPNVRRVCVSQKPDAEARRRGETRGAKSFLYWLSRLLPPRLRVSASKLYSRLLHSPSQTPLLRRLGADLLFCPFTGISLFDPSVPIVAVVALVSSLIVLAAILFVILRSHH